MDTLIRRVKEKVLENTKRGRRKKSWDEVVKKGMKRGLNINDAQDCNKWRRCCRRVVEPGKLESLCH